MKERINHLAFILLEGKLSRPEIESALTTLYNEAMEKAASECINSARARNVVAKRAADAIRKLKV